MWDMAVQFMHAPPASGGQPLLGQSSRKNTSVYPKGVGGGQPAWVAFDRQVGHKRASW